MASSDEKRMSKFKNQSSMWKGYWFRSKVEREHAWFLESERQAGRISKWEYEKNYEIRVNEKHICDHYPDFTVTLPNGVVRVDEVKGGRATMTETWRLKKKLFEACYPGIKYNVVMKGGFR